MIYYFSATGNTLWVAEQLAQATGERLCNIAEIIAQDAQRLPLLEPDERLGFCFPVHGWRPPVLVRRFVSRLRVEAQGHYTYAVCTAGDTLGEAMRIFEHDLMQQGIGLDATHSVIMPNTYVGLPMMDVDRSSQEQHKLAAARTKLQGIVASVVARRHERPALDVGRWPRINSRIIGQLFVDRLITDRPFHVDSTRCVKCGICAGVCPVGDISGGMGQEPTWHHDDSCLTCFACYHHCPHHAIEYGGRTRRKGQYFFRHLRQKPLDLG